MSRRYLDLEIGDQLPHSAPRNITRGNLICPPHCPGRRIPKRRWERGQPEYRETPCQGHWYVLTTQPQREARSTEFLRQNGIFTFHPTKERRTHTKGVLKIEDVPIVPRLVVSLFTQEPQWDVLAQRKIITGRVDGPDGPAVIPHRIAEAMRGLNAAWHETEDARAALKAFAVGDTATLDGTALAGMRVTIARVHGGQVEWVSVENPMIKGRSGAAGLSMG